jgi:hypothetical protein
MLAPWSGSSPVGVQRVQLIEDSTNQVFAEVDFSREEFNAMTKAAESLGITLQEFMVRAVTEDIARRTGEAKPN